MRWIETVFVLTLAATPMLHSPGVAPGEGVAARAAPPPFDATRWEHPDPRYRALPGELREWIREDEDEDPSWTEWWRFNSPRVHELTAEQPTPFTSYVPIGRGRMPRGD